MFADEYGVFALLKLEGCGFPMLDQGLSFFLPALLCLHQPLELLGQAKSLVRQFFGESFEVLQAKSQLGFVVGPGFGRNWRCWLDCHRQGERQYIRSGGGFGVRAVLAFDANLQRANHRLYSGQLLRLVQHLAALVANTGFQSFGFLL